jgi:hypothetical protein
MRPLDSLETERAMQLIADFVDQGQLTREQAQPVVQALFRYGMSDEAGLAFDENCSRLAASVVIVEVASGKEIVPSHYCPQCGRVYTQCDCQDDVPFALDSEPALEDPEDNYLPFDEEPSDLGWDPYAGQYLDDDPIDPYED